MSLSEHQIHDNKSLTSFSYFDMSSRAAPINHFIENHDNVDESEYRL